MKTTWYLKFLSFLADTKSYPLQRSARHSLAPLQKSHPNSYRFVMREQKPSKQYEFRAGAEAIRYNVNLT